MKIVWEDSLEGYGQRIFRLVSVAPRYSGNIPETVLYERNTDDFGNDYWGKVMATNTKDKGVLIREKILYILLTK